MKEMTGSRRFWPLIAAACLVPAILSAFSSYVSSRFGGQGADWKGVIFASVEWLFFGALGIVALELMTNQSLNEGFVSLSTPLIADALNRLKLPLRIAPFGIMPVVAGTRIAGRVLPVRHFGSVDVFLEALEKAEPGDVLVIDNQGRTDEGCIGDLTALEAHFAAIAGIVLWGVHRDTAELERVGMPVFSYGSCPAGPQRCDARSEDALRSAGFGSFEVNTDDTVFADDDGCVFVTNTDSKRVLDTALAIQKTERLQAEAIASDRNLRTQLRFDEYLVRRKQDSSYSFRQHLRTIDGAIEE